MHCLTYYYIRARTIQLNNFIQLNKFSLIPTRLETEGASRQLHYMVWVINPLIQRGDEKRTHAPTPPTHTRRNTHKQHTQGGTTMIEGQDI